MNNLIIDKVNELTKAITALQVELGVHVSTPIKLVALPNGLYRRYDTNIYHDASIVMWCKMLKRRLRTIQEDYDRQVERNIKTMIYLESLLNHRISESQKTEQSIPSRRKRK